MRLRKQITKAKKRKKKKTTTSEEENVCSKRSLRTWCSLRVPWGLSRAHAAAFIW